jgi:hypothetical protein
LGWASVPQRLINQSLYQKILQKFNDNGRKALTGYDGDIPAFIPEKYI